MDEIDKYILGMQTEPVRISFNLYLYTLAFAVAVERTLLIRIILNAGDEIEDCQFEALGGAFINSDLQLTLIFLLTLEGFCMVSGCLSLPYKSAPYRLALVRSFQHEEVGKTTKSAKVNPLEEMLAQKSDEENNESAEDDVRDNNTGNEKKQDSAPEPPSESESGYDDNDGRVPSQAQAYSDKPSNVRPAERRAINDRMMKNILNNPSECMKWFGISKASFMKVLEQLIAEGLPGSAAMSKMERLELFLNLTTTGDPVLSVPRRFGPRMCATAGLACNAVVQALMSIIDDGMPYTLGREQNVQQLPMPVSLERQGQIWEFLNDCLGSMVAVCAPTALAVQKSTSLPAAPSSQASTENSEAPRFISKTRGESQMLTSSGKEMLSHMFRKPLFYRVSGRHQM